MFIELRRIFGEILEKFSLNFRGILKKLWTSFQKSSESSHFCKSSSLKKRDKKILPSPKVLSSSAKFSSNLIENFSRNFKQIFRGIPRTFQGSRGTLDKFSWHWGEVSSDTFQGNKGSSQKASESLSKQRGVLIDLQRGERLEIFSGNFREVLISAQKTSTFSGNFKQVLTDLVDKFSGNFRAASGKLSSGNRKVEP